MANAASMPLHVFIKRVAPAGLAAYEGESYAKLELSSLSLDVSDLAKRACAEFPRWGTDAGQLQLILVTHKGLRKPSADAEAGAKPLEEPAELLSKLGVRSGAWLLARAPPTPGTSTATGASLTRARGLGADADAGAYLARRGCAPGPNPPARPRQQHHPPQRPSLLGDGDLASSLARIEESLRLLPAIKLMLTTENMATARLSDVKYEDQARLKMPTILLTRCGLEVVDGDDASRSALGGLEWDFRTPVLIASTAPTKSNSEAGLFDIFPRKPCYVRPARIHARHVTPTTFGGASEASPAHYFAIFEITGAGLGRVGRRTREPGV